MLWQNLSPAKEARSEDKVWNMKFMQEQNYIKSLNFLFAVIYLNYWHKPHWFGVKW